LVTDKIFPPRSQAILKETRFGVAHAVELFNVGRLHHSAGKNVLMLRWAVL